VTESTGASVVAGAPQEESSMDAKTNMVTKNQSTDFFFISRSPFEFEYGCDTLVDFFNLQEYEPPKI
jgi:hypothetical protein